MFRHEQLTHAQAQTVDAYSGVRTVLPSPLHEQFDAMLRRQRPHQLPEILHHMSIDPPPAVMSTGRSLLAPSRGSAAFHTIPGHGCFYRHPKAGLPPSPSKGRAAFDAIPGQGCFLRHPKAGVGYEQSRRQSKIQSRAKQLLRTSLHLFLTMKSLKL